VIRALRLMWRSFWEAFGTGYRRAQGRGGLRYPEWIAASETRAMVEDVRRARAFLRRFDAEQDRRLMDEAHERAKADDALRDAMRRNGFTERDRRRQAGRES